MLDDGRGGSARAGPVDAAAKTQPRRRQGAGRRECAVADVRKGDAASHTTTRQTHGRDRTVNNNAGNTEMSSKHHPAKHTPNRSAYLPFPARVLHLGAS